MVTSKVTSQKYQIFLNVIFENIFSIVEADAMPNHKTHYYLKSDLKLLF
jgi:hypothetical protein